LAVQWLNEVQFFKQAFEQVESFVLRNRQLLVAAKRYKSQNEATDSFPTFLIFLIMHGNK
jgi:hypothetical protein